MECCRLRGFVAKVEDLVWSTWSSPAALQVVLSEAKEKKGQGGRE